MQAATQLLELAFSAAANFPDSEHDAVASLLLAELESERRWAESFAVTPGQLSALTDEALRDAGFGA